MTVETREDVAARVEFWQTENAKRRSGPWVVAAICLLTIGGLLWFGLNQNVVYFKTVSEALDDGTTSTDRFRLAGAVKNGSITKIENGVSFQVTDGERTITVRHVGDPPDLFRDAMPVVCEGKWGKNSVFQSDRIMVRHGNEYRPPEVKQTQSVEKNK